MPVREVGADQGGGNLLGGGIGLEAGFPCGQHRLRPGIARSLRPVPGQGQPRLLAQGLQPFPRPQRPVGVRLVGEQFAASGEGGGEPAVALVARVHRQRGAERPLVLVASTSTSGETQIWLRSAASRAAAGWPSSASVPRAIDSALDTDRAAARGSRPGNSSSQARSRLTRRPGLTRTSWHSRRALGRGHGPATRPPETTENGPSSLTWTVSPPGGPFALCADTSPLSRTRRTGGNTAGTAASYLSSNESKGLTR